MEDTTATEKKNFVVTGLTSWTGGSTRLVHYITHTRVDAEKVVMACVKFIAQSVAEHGDQPAGSEFAGKWLNEEMLEFWLIDEKTKAPLPNGLLAQFDISEAIEYSFAK